MRTALALVIAAGLAACTAPEETDADKAPIMDEADVSEESEVVGEEEAAEEEAAGLPGTDIHVFALNWTEGGTPALGDRIAGVDRAGYDNQPFFASNSEFLYTAADNETGETDIWRYDITNDASHRVTDTPDASEYSPRIPPGEAELAYLYQAPGEYAGRAYLANPDNSDARPAHELSPVGYYVFSGDMRHVVTFALGEPMTLQLIDRSTEPETVTQIAENPGRTLLRAVSDDFDAFVSTTDENGLTSVKGLTFATGELTGAFDLPAASQDFAVVVSPRAGVLAISGIFAVDGDTLVFRDYPGPIEWAPVGYLAGLSGITRLAVSPDLTMIAIVAEE